MSDYGWLDGTPVQRWNSTTVARTAKRRLLIVLGRRMESADWIVRAQLAGFEGTAQMRTKAFTHSASRTSLWPSSSAPLAALIAAWSHPLETTAAAHGPSRVGETGELER